MSYHAPSLSQPSNKPPIIVVKGTPVVTNAAPPPPPSSSLYQPQPKQQQSLYHNAETGLYTSNAVPASNATSGTVVTATVVPPPPPDGIEKGVGDNSTPYFTSDRQTSNNHEKRFKDVPFAILFIGHLILMGFTCSINAHKLYDEINEGGHDGGGRRLKSLYESSNSFVFRMLYMEGSDVNGNEQFQSNMFRAQQEDGEEQNYDISSILFSLVFTSIAISLVLSSMSLSFMMAFAEGLIKFALIFTCVIYGLSGLLALAVGAGGGAIMSLILCALCVWYTYSVWDRIPFAAVNMKTGISAIKTNIGVALYAYVSLVVMFIWTIWWSITFVSTIGLAELKEEGNDNENEEAEVDGLLTFLFLVSFYWTSQVITNVVHVTVAGVVGTWWFAPHEASSCCSPATRDSFFRATTYSFGSICLGSLIVALIEAMREMVRQARESDDGILVCLADCCLGIIESIVEYFNRWAYVFVGLYGFSFIEAGKNVINLFKSRGWTTIITDNLCDRVLMLVSLGIGLLTGGFVSLCMMALHRDLEGNGSAIFVCFLVAFFIGFLSSSVLMGTISSAIATVIVCYAESPAELELNHPEISREMRASWRQAWPVDFKY